MQTVNPTVKLTDTANTAPPELSFQCKAVQDFRSQQANTNDQSSSILGADPNACSSATPQKHTLSSLSSFSTADSDIDAGDGNDGDGNDDQMAPCMSSLCPV